MSEPQRDSQITARIITVYTATFSFLGLISSAGLAANASILQAAQVRSAINVASSCLLLLALFATFFSLTCLVSQAREEEPDFYNTYLVRGNFLASTAMALGVFLLFWGIVFSAGTTKTEANACVCNSPIYLKDSVQKPVRTCN